ncbi:hypothetical protein E4U17_004073 [Claviceps sp. LM77 group G4]|nr:hypothetical protein E4U33_007503 [Claviceps sp. LM78 group G4]KAG6060523.1 hypothetical protein E4U17_004073 [Claviceps sp. LM77 group G4]KAG6078566.1 hypothetical protein E4U16_001578 [Claviceps sp. LM84 group G4]
MDLKEDPSHLLHTESVHASPLNHPVNVQAANSSSNSSIDSIDSNDTTASPDTANEQHNSYTGPNAQPSTKDKHITSLHQELSLLKQTLAQLTLTTSFWQTKHRTLHQQFLHTDTQLRVLTTEAATQTAQITALQQDRNQLRREALERDAEMGRLRGQVRDMKTFVSMSTRTEGQVSDGAFGEGMGRLGMGVQGWVVRYFRRGGLVDFDCLDPITLAELKGLAPTYENYYHAPGAKVHLLQSIVSRILVEMVLDTYFPGLSDEQVQRFHQMEETLSQLVRSEESINHWRASTLALLRRDAIQTLQDETDTHIEKVTLRIKRILDAITTDGPGSISSAPGSSHPSPRDSSLRSLATDAVDLARLLVAQKAVLRVYIPEVSSQQPILFDPDKMEDVGGEDEDEEALARREIWCVVFPGVIKHGDEKGGRMEFRNVIAKAKVLVR